MPDFAALHRACKRGSFDDDAERAEHLEMRALARLFMSRHVTDNTQALMAALWANSNCNEHARFPDASKVVTSTRKPRWLIDNDVVLHSLLGEYHKTLKDEMSEYECKAVAKTTRMLLASAYVRENGVSQFHLPRVYGLIFGDSVADAAAAEPKRQR